MPKTITCKSGNTYEWTRPPRHVHWRHGRTGQTFQSKLNEIAEGDSEGALSPEERGLLLFESLSEHDAAALERYMNDVLRVGLSYEPTPDRVPEGDFWELFGRAVYWVTDAKVETTEGEMGVETLDTFREEPGVSQEGADVPDVRRKHLGEDGDTRPAAG